MEPKDYKHIRAWGVLTGSYSYYIEQKQKQAAAEKAPINAIYKGDCGWVTADEIKSIVTKNQVEDYVVNLK